MTKNCNHINPLLCQHLYHQNPLRRRKFLNYILYNNSFRDVSPKRILHSKTNISIPARMHYVMHLFVMVSFWWRYNRVGMLVNNNNFWFGFIFKGILISVCFYAFWLPINIFGWHFTFLVDVYHYWWILFWVNIFWKVYMRFGEHSSFLVVIYHFWYTLECKISDSFSFL